MSDKKKASSHNKSSREELFYEKLKNENTSVFIYLINGIKLQGSVSATDAQVVALLNGEHIQMIYKHAISTVVVAVPTIHRGGLDRRFNLKRNHEEDFFQKHTFEANTTPQDNSAWDDTINLSMEVATIENVEDAVYADIISEKNLSAIFLMNGIKLIGHPKINDHKVIFIHTEDGKKLMVYKHAISTVADASTYRNTSEMMSDRPSFGNTARNTSHRTSDNNSREKRFDLPSDDF